MITSTEFKNKFWDNFHSPKNESKIAKLCAENFTLALCCNFVGKDNKRHDVDMVIVQYKPRERSIPAICITIIDVESLESTISIDDHVLTKCSANMVAIGCQEWIISNGKEFLFLPNNNIPELQYLNEDDALDRILKITTNSSPFVSTHIWTQIIKELRKYNLSEECFDAFSSLKFRDEDFVIENRTFYLKPSQEFNLIRSVLLKTSLLQDSGRICRYISLEGLKRLLIDKSPSMSGLAGMNDHSEIWTFESLAEHDASWKSQYVKLPNIIQNANSYFINSFTDCNKYDDLTMWRLYGEEGRGACLTYEYSFDAIDHNANLFLLPVHYVRSISSDIMKTLDCLNNNINLCSRRFILKNLNVWQHFIKPIEFKDEAEVRLLMHYPKEQENKCSIRWILNSENKIFQPILIFNNYKSYPLKLVKITLGPNFPFVDTNIGQVKYLAGLIDSSIQVRKSSCRFYR